LAVELKRLAEIEPKDSLTVTGTIQHAGLTYESPYRWGKQLDNSVKKLESVYIQLGDCELIAHSPRKKP